MGCTTSRVNINKENERKKSVSRTQFTGFYSTHCGKRAIEKQQPSNKDKASSSSQNKDHYPSNSIRSIILTTPTSSLRLSSDFSFQYILKDTNAREKFRHFLTAQHALENLMFYEYVETLKNTPPVQLKQAANFLMEEFLIPGVDNEVNISDSMKKSIIHLIQKDEEKFVKEADDFFLKLEKAQHEIVKMLMMGSYPNFLKSKYFKEYLLTDGRNFVLKKDPAVRTSSNLGSSQAITKSEGTSESLVVEGNLLTDSVGVGLSVGLRQTSGKSGYSLTSSSGTPFTCSTVISTVDPLTPAIVINTTFSRENSTRSKKSVTPTGSLRRVDCEKDVETMPEKVQEVSATCPVVVPRSGSGIFRSSPSKSSVLPL